MKSHKPLAVLRINWYMSNQQQKSYIKGPINDVSYAQIAFKKRIFQANTANAHVEL